MSTKLSFFTDLHLRGQGSSSRKDDYPTAILNKLEFCLKYASKNSSIALFGGDFCHSYRLASDSIKEKTIEIFDNHLEVPFLYTWGQHDLNGKDYESRHGSSKAFILRQISRINPNIEEVPTDLELIKEINGLKIGFVSCPSGFDPISWSKEISKKEKNVDIRIALVHHLISNEEQEWFINPEEFTTGIKDKRSIDVVLCGDLHQGFPSFRNSYDTLFLNPGSLGRTQKTKNDLIRPIQGVDVIINKNNIKFEYWSVECAQEGKDVFRSSAPVINEKIYLEEQAKCNEDIGFEEVIVALKDIKTSKIDIWDMLENKAKENKLPEEIIDFILKQRPDA